ncbi:hypothetical protein [Aquimarina pacifica]|uniref:hypothetical protein n=1 Tax=Aquimarina pacifica TaxID=1296415 RepID=UPI00046E5A92|nr:hypothetical protein [Aquimarina pacifica]
MTALSKYFNSITYPIIVGMTVTNCNINKTREELFQKNMGTTDIPKKSDGKVYNNYEIAERYAPKFHQYIFSTNKFNFKHDNRNNNHYPEKSYNPYNLWKSNSNPKIKNKTKPFVYYYAAQTKKHFSILYVAYPIDHIKELQGMYTSQNIFDPDIVAVLVLANRKEDGGFGTVENIRPIYNGNGKHKKESLEIVNNDRPSIYILPKKNNIQTSDKKLDTAISHIVYEHKNRKKSSILNQKNEPQSWGYKLLEIESLLTKKDNSKFLITNSFFAFQNSSIKNHRLNPL